LQKDVSRVQSVRTCQACKQLHRASAH
jgi:hypothetical protein